MKSREYWARRAAQRQYEYQKQADAVADELAKAYIAATNEIKTEIRKIFSGFKLEYGLSEAAAFRLLTKRGDSPNLDSLKSVIAAMEDGPAKKELQAILASPAYAYRIRRFQQLQKDIDKKIQELAGTEEAITREHYVTLAGEAYDHSIFDVQKGTGIGFSFSEMPKSMVEEILRNKWSGALFSERIWKNLNVANQTIKEELLVGFMTGRSYRKTAKCIEKRMAVGSMEARRLVRTESTYIACMAELESYKEMGVEKYRYVATLDMRTSEMCAAMDGKVFAVEDGVPGKNMPPLHPWCRSTTIAELEDDVTAKLKRRARDPETGKLYEVPADMTYEEWKKSLDKERGAGYVDKRRRMAANETADREQYEKYKAIFGKDFPKTFDSFQNLKYNNSEEWSKFKTQKQERLNQMDFNKMGKLKGKLGNQEVRLWYKTHDERIHDIIDRSKPIKEQAIESHGLRNTYRMQARELMKDQKEREYLDKNYPNKSFEELVDHKKIKYGMPEEEAYKDIIRSSATTNKKFDDAAGVKE